MPVVPSGLLGLPIPSGASEMPVRYGGLIRSEDDRPRHCELIRHPSSAVPQVLVGEIRRIDCGSELPAFEGEALSLGAVRHLASNSGLKEICFNGKDAVVLFAAGMGTCSVRRHNVYFQTATVCSSFKHPRQGQTHIVRRKMDTVSI